MSCRVDRIDVVMDVYQEFEGRSTVSFSYIPASDDPLAAALVAKNDELSLAAARAAGPADVGIG